MISEMLVYAGLGLSLLMLAMCVPLASGQLDLLRTNWFVAVATVTAPVAAANLVIAAPWQAEALLLPPYAGALAMFYWSHLRLRRLEHEQMSRRWLLSVMDRELAAWRVRQHPGGKQGVV